MEKETPIRMKSKNFNPKDIRHDFPILSSEIHERPLIYLDNAATSQKPVQVIQSIKNYYHVYNANVHRGVHYLSQVASAAFEESRTKVRDFINAKSEREVIFTSGTTASINIVAQSFALSFLKAGDEIIISAMEHHSNIVPWQMICDRYQTKLRVCPMQANGELDMHQLELLINSNTKLIAVVYVSNALGTINPVEDIIQMAHERKVPVMLDAAQAICHLPIDVQKLDIDFLVFSGHKMMAGTGIGILYGKEEWLSKMKPVFGGGEMIKSVSFEKTIYNELPFVFEPGTPNIEGAISLGSAIDYWNDLDRFAVEKYEQDLIEYLRNELKQIERVHLIGTAGKVTGVASFIVDGINALDLGMYLDTVGIAVRTGHHCAEPIMDFYKITGTLRASIMFYNTIEEVDIFIEQLQNGIDLLQ